MTDDKDDRALQVSKDTSCSEQKERVRPHPGERLSTVMAVPDVIPCPMDPRVDLRIFRLYATPAYDVTEYSKEDEDE